MKIRISKKFVGEDSPVFIIAEAGLNHNGNVNIAKKLINTAQKCGADAIKFQTFKTENFIAKKSDYFKLFKKLELIDSEFTELSKYAKSKKIIFLSTPFSNDSVDLLSKLNVSAFKIASGDLTNLPLIKYASSKMKPMIISTGMSNMNEVSDALKTIKSTKNKKIMIMHSISSYPAPTEEVNLSSINQLQKKFPYPIGFSDNGDNELVSLAAVARGAKLIEKHFTLNKKMSGPDHSISSNPKELKNLITNIRIVEKLIGSGIKSCQPSEMNTKTLARRSVTASIPIPKGVKLTLDMLSIKRPATGIEPKFFNKILGKKTTRKISMDESIRWKDIR
jgi:N,N'-diacetyllegionaminate synthase